MLVQATEENNDTTAAWAVLRYQRVQEVPWLWATSWLNSASEAEQRHHQLRLFPAKNILNTAGPSISDNRNSLWGLKTAHLWANFSESNSFLLPWRSVIIEGVIYNGGVWISAPSLQRPEQPGRLPNNRPAATTGHSEVQVWTCQKRWWRVNSWLKGQPFSGHIHDVDVSASVIRHTSDPENKQAETEALWPKIASPLILPFPVLPVLLALTRRCGSSLVCAGQWQNLEMSAL